MRRHPIDENRGDALTFTGVGSLFTAIAAVLLEYPTFATIFAFFSTFALAVAVRDARKNRLRFGDAASRLSEARAAASSIAQLINRVLTIQ